MKESRVQFPHIPNLDHNARMMLLFIADRVSDHFIRQQGLVPMAPNKESREAIQWYINLDSELQCKLDKMISETVNEN